ncbi:sugar ABC transporter permease [Capsulimonas corticalis]|uniref:Autoinducer 2 import system permease protein LsrD n=1 Tax=Capsulimonas corticalis TaxID=2219043 RepID=A0A402D401_9BACT|nr:ABC transporter permease [Capsulimonas corticalis]BDI31197.1 sugar ABC transporter permease [Capsulimonas corticalis]
MQQVTKSDRAIPAKRASPLRGVLPSRQEIVLLVLLIGLMILAGSLSPTFLAPNAQMGLSTHVWELALLAIPMTLIIVTAGIDLSVGSTMALCAVVFGLCFQAHMPLALAGALTLATGAAAGALNGFFITRVRVHPLIVTLATLAAYRGVAEGLSLGRPVSGFPESFTWLGQGTVLGIPIPGLIFGVAVIAVGLIAARTPLGLWLSAIGYNETASLYSGIAVARIKMWLYTLSGTTAGLAALLFVARRNTAKADIGTGMELAVITAVVLGGTSIFGGRGRLFGTVLGVLLIHETREFVSWQWNRDELNLIVIGLLLILSVLADSLLTPKSRR